MEHEREVRILLTLAVNEQAKAQSQRAVEQSLTQMEAAAKRSGESVQKAVDKHLQSQVKAHERAEKEISKARERAEKQHQSSVERQAKASAAAADKEVAASVTAANKREKYLADSYAKQTKAAAAAADKEVAASMAAANKWEKYLADSYAKQTKAAEKAASDSARAQKAASRQYEFAAMRQQVAFEQVGRRLERVGMSALRVGRGLALLWAGENKQKALEYEKAIVNIVAVFDLMRGVSGMIRGIAGAWRAVEVATKSATAAQAAYAAVSLVTAGAGGAGAAGAIGGAGKVAIGGAGVLAMQFGWRGRALAGMASGMGAIKTGGAALGAAVATPAVMGTVATAGVGAAGYSAVRVGMDAYKYGPGMGGAPGGFTETVGTSNWNPYVLGLKAGSYVPGVNRLPILSDIRQSRATRTPYSQYGNVAEYAEKDVEYAKAKAAREQQAETEERLARTYLATRMSGETQLRELQFARPGMTLAQQRAEAQSQLGVVGRANVANMAVPRDDRTQYQQDAINFGVQEEIKLRRQVQEIMVQQSRSVDEITARQRTLASEIENQQRGTKQAFGAMSRPEQQRLIQAAERYRAGTSSREDEEMLSRVAPSGGATAVGIGKKREARADVAGWGRLGLDKEFAEAKQATERDAEKAIEAIKGNRVKLAEIGKLMAKEIEDGFKEVQKSVRIAVEEAKKEARADNAIVGRGQEQLNAADRAVNGQ